MLVFSPHTILLLLGLDFALIHQIIDCRMLRAGGAEDPLGLALAICLPDILDVDHGQHDALGIAERDFAARLELFGKLFRDIERDRDRPERAVREPHLAANRLIIGLAQKAGERREAAVREQLQVAQLPRREVPRRPVARLPFDLGGALR